MLLLSAYVTASPKFAYYFFENVTAFTSCVFSFLTDILSLFCKPRVEPRAGFIHQKIQSRLCHVIPYIYQSGLFKHSSLVNYSFSCLKFYKPFQDTVFMVDKTGECRVFVQCIQG